MQNLFRWLLLVVALAALVYPGQVFFDVRGGAEFLQGLNAQATALAMFPLYGLYAFTLLWLQLMLGSLMPWLRRVYRGIERVHRWLGVFVFLFAVTHPALLVFGIGLERYLARDFIAQENALYLFFGQTAVLVLSLTVLTALLRNLHAVRRWWRLVHVSNYAIFILVWFHSWYLGTDVQDTGLRTVWMVYAVAFVVALVVRLLGRTWPLRYPLIVAAQVGNNGTEGTTPSASGSDGFVRAAALDDLHEGRPFCATVDHQRLALFRFGPKIYALENQCNHAGASLCSGVLEGATIECPLHFSRFDVQTGRHIDGPANRDQATYPVEIRGQDVYVKI